MLVIDATAATELLLARPAAEAVAGHVSERGLDLHAPHLIDVEVASAVRRLVASGDARPERGEEAIADLLDPARRGVTVIRRDGREWRGPAFALDLARGPQTVWGFTAMLLDGLFDRLGWTEAWDATREIPLPEPVVADPAVPPEPPRS